MGKQEILQIEGLDELTIAVHYLKERGIGVPKSKILEAKEIIKLDKIIFLKITTHKVPYIKKTMVTVKFIKKREVHRREKFRDYIKKIRDADNEYLAEKSMHGTSVVITLTLICLLVWVIFFRFNTPSF